VHELAADVRSWRLLLDDLCTGWRQLAGGTPPRLAPAKPFLGIISERSATPLQPAGDDCRLPAPTGYEGRIRTRVRTAGPPAAAVASALATALLEWRGGRRLTVDIADHTACDGHGRRVGQLSDVDSVEFIAGHP